MPYNIKIDDEILKLFRPNGQWTQDNIPEEEKKYIEAANQKAFIWFPKHKIFTKVIVNLSGGCDSAMALWQFLLYLKEREIELEEIRVLTGVDKYRPTNEWNAREIFLGIKENFPEFPLVHDIFYYWKKGDKRTFHMAYEKGLFEDKGFNCMLHGRTANPPPEIQKEIPNFWDNKGAPKERDITNKNKKDSYQIWPKKELNTFRFMAVPWEYVDKKFIAELYYKIPFMKNEIFPVTASCIGYAKDTNHFEKACGKCWWCHEKKWAFGCLDGGELK